MPKFSEWEVIPADRKCDLPFNTRVRVMWSNETVEYADRKDTTVFVVDCLRGGCWLNNIFAVSYVIEPVKEEKKSVQWLAPNGFLSTSETVGDSIGAVRGIVTQTNVNSKPVKLVWEADE